MRVGDKIACAVAFGFPRKAVSVKVRTAQGDEHAARKRGVRAVGDHTDLGIRIVQLPVQKMNAMQKLTQFHVSCLRQTK